VSDATASAMLSTAAAVRPRPRLLTLASDIDVPLLPPVPRDVTTDVRAERTPGSAEAGATREEGGSKRRTAPVVGVVRSVEAALWRRRRS